MLSAQALCFVTKAKAFAERRLTIRMMTSADCLADIFAEKAKVAATMPVIARAL